MNYGIIYKCHNIINNKVYIGQTTRNIKQRIKEHFNHAPNAHFKNAIDKYSSNNFRWNVIDTANSFNELNFKEIFYISCYNSANRKYGYNISAGGNNPILRGENNGMYGKTHSDEIKKKISELRFNVSWDERFGEKKSQEYKEKLSISNKGSKRSKETKKKMSDNQWLKEQGYLISGENNPNYENYWSNEQKLLITGKNNGMYGKGHLVTGEKNGMYGKTHSDEIKKKMSIKNKGSGNPSYYYIDILIIEEIKNLYILGYSFPYISKKYNICVGKIKRELLIHNVILRNGSEQKIKNHELKLNGLL